MLSRLDARLEGLSTSSFALVMATGIVSIGAHLLGVAVVDVALFAVDIAAYPILWLLTALRLARHRAAVLRDLTDHQRSVGFLTVVAGTCVLGSQTLLIGGGVAIASGLLVLGALLWLFLIYTIFTALTIKRTSRRWRRASTAAGCLPSSPPSRSPS